MIGIHFSALSLSRLSVARAVAVLLAAMSPGAEAGSSQDADVIGRMSGLYVSSDEIRSYLQTLAPQDRAVLAKDPAPLSQVVRAYLARRAVLKEALAKKWDQQPLIKAQLDRAREQGLIELYLHSLSHPPPRSPTHAPVQPPYDALN